MRGLLHSFLVGELASGETAARDVPIHLFTDCKSLYDHLHKDGVPKPPSEKRLALDLASMRQELNREALAHWLRQHGSDVEVRPDRPRRIPLHWVPTEIQLADVLTKRMSPAQWWQLVERGELAIPLKVWKPPERGS